MYVVVFAFVGEMFAHMWLFAHLRAKCLHKCGCLHISRLSNPSKFFVLISFGDISQQVKKLTDENSELMRKKKKSNLLHKLLYFICFIFF